MPSHRATGATVEIEGLSAVGSVASNDGFVAHVGLAAGSGTFDLAAIPVFEMRPPLMLAGAIRADAIGNMPLSPYELRRIQNFVNRQAAEHSVGRFTPRVFAQFYCVHPHADEFRDETGNFRVRFSCCGFVFAAYQEAGIHLLEIGSLPTVNLDLIKRSYPGLANRLDRPELRESLGLTGPGPWPVLLCGYLFHALNRDDVAIRQTPYVPRPGDGYFR